MVTKNTHKTGHEESKKAISVSNASEDRLADALPKRTIGDLVGDRFIDDDRAFEPGNVYSLAVPPFTTVPSWMRQFMFRILKANEIAVYVYIATFVQKAGVAWVPLRYMQRDFGLSNRHELIKSIDQLVLYGFLLKTKGRIARSKTEHDRSIYQRPSTMYTLLKLLRTGAIDGFFNPTPKAALRVHRGSAKLNARRTLETSIRMALTNLLGPDTVKTYLQTPGAQKVQVLIDALVAKLTAEMRAAGASHSSVSAISGPVPVFVATDDDD